jgi:type IV pilus modification protein PilV
MHQLKPPHHRLYMPHLAQTATSQSGIALLEALVALLILAFGVLGLLWMHQQALAQQRQQLMRSVAMGLADDLAERMHLNAVQRVLYAKAWSATAATGPDCATTPCSRQDLAMWDMQQFQQNLQSQLPEGDAAVFALTDVAQWWGIVIAWRDVNETYRTDTASGTPPCPAQMSCWRLFFRPDR